MLQLLCATIEVGLYLVLCAACAHLVRLSLWALRRGPLEAAPLVPPTSRSITVQLPLRNEAQMAEALLRSSAKLEGSGLEVQALDDSDDETSAILDRVSAELRVAGHSVTVLRRPDRRGYKAGNLAYGLARSHAEYVLVLDADFRPEPDLASQLARSLDEDPQLAFVQARWSFRNATTTLGRLQAAILDALFCIEQAALSEACAPVQFNGTGGMWRRSAIDRAGGWDTSETSLTEDLDLSFRAHQAGLRGRTRPELVVSTELPTSMHAFRAQQARWVRGAALTVRTLGGRLVNNASLRAALTIAGHLARHARQPLFVAALVRLPLVAFGLATPISPAWLGPVLVTGAIGSATLYLGAGAMRAGQRARPLDGVRLALLSIGLAPTLAVAFLGGLAGRRGRGFVRTVKGSNLDGAQPDVSRREAFTAALCVVSCVALIGFARTHDVPGVVAALLCAVGTGWVAL
ncbi:MAG: glycosyltransferase family 2 protein [Polyangia bacterium]